MILVYDPQSFSIFSIPNMKFLQLLLTISLAAALTARRGDHHHDDHFMKELTTMSRKDYGSNLSNGTTAEREILVELYDATNGPEWYDSPGNN